MRGGAAHHRDHEWCARQTDAFGFDVLGLGLRVFGGKRRGDGLAGGQPRLTLEDDEAPGHKLAVIGDARSNGKQRLDLGGGRAGASEFDRFD